MAVEEGIGALQQVSELWRIGNVAIVDEVYAEGGVYKEWLCFLR